MELFTIITTKIGFFSHFLVSFDLEHDGNIMKMYYMKSERPPSEKGRVPLKVLYYFRSLIPNSHWNEDKNCEEYLENTVCHAVGDFLC